jgi:hypothetical protein
MTTRSRYYYVMRALRPLQCGDELTVCRGRGGARAELFANAGLLAPSTEPDVGVLLHLSVPAAAAASQMQPNIAAEEDVCDDDSVAVPATTLALRVSAMPPDTVAEHDTDGVRRCQRAVVHSSSGGAAAAAAAAAVTELPPPRASSSPPRRQGGMPAEEDEQQDEPPSDDECSSSSSSSSSPTVLVWPPRLAMAADPAALRLEVLGHLARLDAALTALPTTPPADGRSRRSSAAVEAAARGYLQAERAELHAVLAALEHS